MENVQYSVWIHENASIWPYILFIKLYVILYILLLVQEMIKVVLWWITGYNKLLLV